MCEPDCNIMSKTFFSRAGLALASTILFACSSAPVAPPSALELDQVFLVSGNGPPIADLQDDSPFLALSPEMEEFVQRVVPSSASATQRLDALFDAFRFSHVIEYDDHATLTAAEAFRQQRANCLSFSAMFIAMARAMGLDAHFQEVDVPPTWDSSDDQTLIQYRHVNVVVRLGRVGEAVIDLRPDRYSETYPRRVVSDAAAQAHYYSNLSMNKLIAGDLVEAQHLAHRALLADDRQAFVWNNMGIIQRRKGRLDLAEISYRQALALNHLDWSAMSNLAYIFERGGNYTEAARLRAFSDQTKLRDPYYRYALALRDYRRGDYQAAVLHLNQAILRQRNEPRFFYLRGLSHWQLGASTLAVAEMQRAIVLAADTNSRFSYERQLAEWQLEGSKSTASAD